MNERHVINGSNSSPEEQLFWTAAQYAAGDLSEAAAAEFEARLETDQEAREALAQAVALEQAVVQVESAPAAMPASVVAAPARRGHTAAWIAVAAAVALAFFAYDGRRSTEPAQDEIAAAPTQAQQQLALAWVEGQTADETIDLIGEASLTDPMDYDEMDESLTSTTEPSAPDWLLLAVADAAATGGD